MARDFEEYEDPDLVDLDLDSEQFLPEANEEVFEYIGPLTFGDEEDLVNPIAQQLVVVHQEELARLKNDLSSKFQRIGDSWQDTTFYNPRRKPTILPELQEQWREFFPVVLRDIPDQTATLLQALARGIKVSEDRKSRTHHDYIYNTLYFKGAKIVRHPVPAFLDRIDPEIGVSDPTHIFIHAFQELSDDTRPNLDDIVNELRRDDVRSMMIGSGDTVQLPLFITSVSDLLVLKNQSS